MVVKFVNTWLQSHPTRMRGLKLRAELRYRSLFFVASYADAWIEMLHGRGVIIRMPTVASYADAWIEIEKSELFTVLS